MASALFEGLTSTPFLEKNFGYRFLLGDLRKFNLKAEGSVMKNCFIDTASFKFSLVDQLLKRPIEQLQVVLGGKVNAVSLALRMIFL